MRNALTSLAIGPLMLGSHCFALGQSAAYIEADSWVFPAIAKMYKAGVLVGYPGGGGGFHEAKKVTQLEVAYAVSATAEHIHWMLDGLQKEAVDPSLSRAQREVLLNDLKEVPKWTTFMRDLRMMAIHLRPEFRELGGYKKTIDLLTADDTMIEKIKALKLHPPKE